MNKKQEKGILDQLDMRSMLRDVLRQWWVILCFAIAASLFANVYENQKYKPEYSVSATFAVSARGMNNSIYQNLSTTVNMAEQLTLVLDSSLLKKKVAEELGMNSFPATTKVSQISETNLIRLEVRAGSAVTAYRITRSILQNYNKVSDYVMNTAIIEMVQQPQIPMSPANPLNTKRSMKMAFLAAAAFFTLLFAAISYLKDTVKNEQEAEDKIDTRFLGSIYHENKKQGIRNRKNRSMLITNAFHSFRFVESNKMVAARIRSRMDQRRQKVLMITSVMENEGKSTVAANLALALAQENKKVLLVDFDLRKPAQYKIFDVPKDQTVNLPEVIRSKTGLDTMIRKHPELDLFMLFNGKAAYSMEQIVASDTMKQIMQFCRERMDYIIVDTSPMMLVSDTEEIAALCDASVLVVRQDLVLSKDINDTIDRLNRSRAHVLGCVYNNVQASLLSGVGNYGYGGRYGKYGKYGKR